MSIGPSTTTTPYILASQPNVRFTSIVTAGDALPANGVFAGKADGIGAFDNGDGTITVLVNHELGASQGIVRDHGSTGAYVDRLVINKATLQIVSSDDLIKTVKLWNDATDSYVTKTTAFNSFCSGDLAAPTAFYNSASGLGTTVRIYLTGEEAGTNGRAFATVVTGPNAGAAYELPYFGNLSFENAVANPQSQQKTIVALTDDAVGGQVYFYIGQKLSTGTDIEKAGLTGGDFYGLKVSGFANEVNGTPVSGSFTLQEIGPGGDVSNMSGGAIETESDAEGVTGFLRPEDCAWDPDHPNVLYFVTTNSFTGNSRLYKATFADITNPQLGGTIVAVLDGSEGQHMFDNITVAGGKVILQEDPGDNAYLAKIWQYDIATDSLTQIAGFDPARFSPGGSGFITKSEESSGVIDVTALLGDSDTRAYLVDAQVHSATGNTATVQKGQLMVMYVDAASSPPPPPSPPPGPVLIGGPGDDILTGTSASETLRGNDGNDTAFAGGGNDFVYGGAGNDRLHGEDGNDNLFGQSGNDQLYGEAGNDSLSGGKGADRLEGGLGNDTMTGGEGSDYFIFDNRGNTGADTINDFAGSERLLTTVALPVDNSGHIRFNQTLSLFGSSTVDINNGSSNIKDLAYMGTVQVDGVTYHSYADGTTHTAVTAATTASMTMPADHLF